MSKPPAFVSEKKKKEVKELQDLMLQYPIIGIVNLENLPAPQLQKIRQQLRGTVVIRMSKGRLIKVAMDNLKGKIKGIEQLEKEIKGMPALILTKENPFKLYKTLEKSKSSAPAKPGQKAPKDIVIQAGPTSFAPGPLISELGSIGIKTGIEDGKVVVKEDSLIVKEGEEIKPKVADVLAKLGIEPMEVGLNVVAVLENGTIFTSKVLAIDERKYLDKIRTAAADSLALTISIGYPTEENVKLLLAKAENEVCALADSIDYPTPQKVKKQLAQAEMEEKALEITLNLDAASEEEAKPKQEEASHEESEEKTEEQSESQKEA